MYLVEQLSLQRQLEAVQLQHQQLLAQQQQLSQSQGLAPLGGPLGGPLGQMGQMGPQGMAQNAYQQPNLSYLQAAGSFGQFATPVGANGPPANAHRRSQSSMGPPQHAYGSRNPNPNPPEFAHNRRSSLGVSEAKKAAAIVQSQRASPSPTTPTPTATPTSTSTTPISATNSFKFPPTPDSARRQPAHNRSQSLAYNNNNHRSFQFPPSNESSFHERRSSAHYRTNSRNYDNNNNNNNWRQNDYNANFVPGHRSRGSANSSMSSIQAFNMSNNNPQQRKSLFAPYLPQASLPDLIKEGKLVTGILRVNKKNRSDAYVSTDGLLDSDIFICGSKDRNRALEGDLVAVELLVVDEVWNSKKSKEEKKRRKEAQSTDLDDKNDASRGTDSSSLNVSSSSNTTSLKRRGSLKQRPTQKKNDDVEVEGQSLLLTEEEEINDDYKPLYAGHIVAVIDRIPGQLFSGTLGLLRPSQKSKNSNSNSNSNSNKDDNRNNNSNNNKPKIVWFKQTDKKVPLIAIPTEQAPQDFIENHSKYSNKLFIASIKRWPITSLHPFGNLISEIGEIDNKNTEIISIIRDNNFMFDEYPNELENYNPESTLKNDDLEYLNLIPDPNIDILPTDEILKDRRDFTNDDILSLTYDKLYSDHAFHIKKISNEKIEFGIHISDITNFISINSILDKKIKKRSTSLFLYNNKNINLLPEKLNKLISFYENKIKLSLSVVFEIDTKNFEIENIWMGEGFIKSKKLISYDLIDTILNDESKINNDNENKNEIEDLDQSSIDYIKTLNLISREFKRQRLDNPNLENNEFYNLNLLNQLDDEKLSSSLSLNIFDFKKSEILIDEIFLKINSTIGQKLLATLGSKTFLRKHSIPTLNKIELFVSKCKKLGINIDVTNSSTLQNSIFKIKDLNIRKSIEILLIKVFQRGKYYISGKNDSDNNFHYIFNLPIYTHFTCPIRRYSDHIVHRQFKSMIHNETIDESIDNLKMAADYCNFKKDCCKNAQDQSIHLNLSHLINRMSKETGGQLIVNAIVLQVYESAFDVFLPDFGIEKRVHGDQLPLVKAEFNKNERLLELYWEKGVDSATFIPDDERAPLAYHSSIKNRYRSSSIQSAVAQDRLSIDGKLGISKNDLINNLNNLSIDNDNDEINSNTSINSSKDTTLSLSSSPKLNNDNENKIHQNENEDETSLKGNEIISKIITSNLNGNPLSSYLENVIIREDGNNYIQEIRELKQVPILLRAEIGMALPCLTVRSVNPFM